MAATTLSAGPPAGAHPLLSTDRSVEPWLPPGPTLAELVGATGTGFGAVLARPLLVAALRVAWGGSGRTRPVQDPAPGLEGDPGWFGPASSAWKIHGDTSMFVAGITAFALQLLHPLALAGVADHSSFAEDFLGRVERTGQFVQGVVYGDSAEAARRCAQVRAVHRRVRGTAPDGRPYDASDPDLLGWVHLGEHLAIASAYRRFGAHPVNHAELDRYVAEVATSGVAVGVADPPRSWAALDAALGRYRADLEVGDQARAALRFLTDPPGLPAAARPAWAVVFAGAISCLPPWARDMLGVARPGATSLVACRALIRSLSVLAGPPPPLSAARRRLGLDP